QLNVLHQAASCSSCYGIRDSAGFQNITWTELGNCAYLMSPKKGETGRGLSQNFQQPYEYKKRCPKNQTDNYALYIFIKKAIHKVAENSSTAHNRFRPSWGSSGGRSH
ncbi:hypothetical protein CSKR_112983, partial [Clonorchis sinensis]